MQQGVEHLTFGNLVWVFVGLILLVLVDMLRARKKHNSSFSYLIYIKENILQFVIAFISSYTMFYHADSFTEGILDVHVHGDSGYYAWFAVACGYNGHVVVDRLNKSFK